MINIIGLGYIGLPTAFIFAKSGVRVVAELFVGHDMTISKIIWIL